MFSEPNEEQALFDRARGGPLAKFSAQRGTELDFPKPVSNHALSRKSVSHHDSTKVGNTPIDEMLNFTGQGTGNEPFFQQQELPGDVGMISQIFSLPLIRCKVVESSGLGAYTAIPQPSSDIGTFSSRCWSTNMSSCSEPYVILQSSAKEYARRQLVDKASHIRNIDAHVIFVESSSFPSPSTPCIVSIMCSNHPKSGFVPVASRSVDALSATFRIPGTAMCPFIKLRIKPLSPSVKLVRIQAVALTLSASWTEEVANDNLETQSSVELRDVTNILTSNLSKIPGSCEREEAIGLLGRSSHQRIKFPQQDCHFGVSIDEGRTHESLDSDASRSPNNSHGTPAFNWYSGETETLSRKVNDFFSICEQMILRQQSYNDVETTWSNIPLWTHREALHFGMSRAVAISASICYNTRESLCSCLTQPFGFSILSVLSQKAASEQNLLATHFDTMSCISHFIGANGLHIELAFRVSNGFCCAICPNVPLCAYNARVEKKWLLVLQGDKKEEITDIIKLASDVFREGLPQGGCQLRSHGALSIILDLTNSFCELMASMHQWVCINALHYYGSEDQYPLRYLRTSGSLSNVTNWGGFSLCGRRMPSNIVESEEIGRHYSLLHLQLRLHTPAFFVWESRQRLSPRVILTDVHISEALPMVDGAMVPDTVLGLCSGLSRNMNQSSMIVGKMIVATDQPWRDLLKCANTLEDREKVCEADYSTLLEKSRRVTSTFTLHALGTAFRQEWTTIAISLPEDLLPFKVKIKGEEFSLLDEDVFMDTLSRWPYAYPKNVVVFVMSDTSDVGHSVAVSRSLEPRLSPLFSTNALRAFSRARNLRDSLSFH